MGNCSFPSLFSFPPLPFFLIDFFILMTQMVIYRNFSYLWNKLLQIRFKWFKKSWATPFSHSGLSLYKPIKVWIKDLPAWINIPLWDIWVSFLSLFYHVLSVFFYWDNNFSESIAYHNNRAFYAFNECNCLPNEVVYIAIYSIIAE